MINPRNIEKINKDIECAVLAILNLICKEEVDLKGKIGGPFLIHAAIRMEFIKKYQNDQAAIDFHMEKNQTKKVREIMEDTEKVHELLLKPTGYANVTVPYKQNRAVLFDSALFHNTDKFSFKKGKTVFDGVNCCFFRRLSVFS